MRTLDIASGASPFIGRERELAEIDALLDDPACRLLTLLGPGGIGKSRLAQEVAPSLDHHFRDGVYYVLLQPLRSGEHILSAVIETLPIQADGSTDLQQRLLNYLRDKQLLLILDNVEHLLDGVDLIVEILDTAPNVKVLATSREALNLRDEWLRQLRGLDFPVDKAVWPLTSYSAVRLFAERARQQSGDFDLDAEAEGVIRICQLVDGVPLAIELAVGWIRSLSCAAIADEIQSRIDFLSQHKRDIPERHRSMRAVFDQSWHLLSPHEAAVMRGFAVFRGGCALEAAHAILDASVELLARLVDKSLLHFNTSTGRYGVQELQRQYAEEQLQRAREEDGLRDRHCQYYAAWFHAHESDNFSSVKAEHLYKIHLELDNLRAAWAWALERARYEVIDQLVETLWNYFTDYTMAFELGALTQAASEQLADSTKPHERAILGRVLARQGKWTINFGQVEQAEALFYQSMSIAQEQNNLEEYYYALRWLAAYVLAPYHAEYPDAQQKLEACIAYHRKRDDKIALALSLGNLANVFGAMGRVTEQEALWHEAFGLYKHLNYQHGMSEVLWQLGVLAKQAGRWNEASQHLLASGNLEWERRGNIVQTCTSFVPMEASYVALMQGDFNKAEEWIKAAVGPLLPAEAGLTISFQVRINCHLIECLIQDARGAAPTVLQRVEAIYARCEQRGGLQELVDRSRLVRIWILCNLDDYDTVVREFPATLATAQRNQRKADELFAITIGARILAANGELIRAAELLGLVFSRPNSPRGYFEHHQGMTQLQSDLEAQLGADALSNAWERGTRLNIDTVISGLLNEPTTADQNCIVAANHALPEPLTPREIDVLALLGDGLTNPQIAARLFITVGTVKSHTHKVYSKLAVANRAQAVARAQELHLL